MDMFNSGGVECVNTAASAIFKSYVLPQDHMLIEDSYVTMEKT